MCVCIGEVAFIIQVKSALHQYGDVPFFLNPFDSSINIAVPP